MHRSDFPSLQKMLCAFAILLVVALTSACAPSVGDSCETRAECPSGAICDTTAPEGYCTYDDCVRNGCSEDSLCIFFDAETSYCMKSCDNDSECRTDEGYVCRDDVGTIPFCYAPAATPSAS